MTILAYDIEVFKHQATVVFKDMDCNTVRIFTNNLAGLGDYIDKGIITEQGFRELEEFIEDKTLVGYNNYWYDDYILYAMSKDLGQEVIKTWNDSIIQNGSKLNMKKISCKTLDAFQQIDVSRPGLKKIEGNMGKMIFESEVDFDIDRPLTPDENLETVKYCEYDVEQTVYTYKMRNDYFGTKETIINMLEEEHLKEKAVKWNTTSIVGQLLKPERKAPSRRLVSDEYMSIVPAEVQEMWRQLDHTIDFKFKKKKVIVNEFGNAIEFGWGGLHGAPKGFCERKNVKLLDVSLT